MEKIGVPGEIHCLTQVTGKFITCPGLDLNPGSGERQGAVCGNTLDPFAIRAGHSVERQGAVCGNTLDPSAIKAGPV